MVRNAKHLQGFAHTQTSFTQLSEGMDRTIVNNMPVDIEQGRTNVTRQNDVP
jgi:hypothetical protein